MREAIGSSLLLNIVIVFVSIIIVFFVGTLSYSKAYRAKNRIVSVIEKYEDYNDGAKAEIKTSLGDMGYQIGECNDSEGASGSGYKVCIYRKETEDGTYYYKVKTYVQFYFPIINSLFSPAVSSETKLMGKNYNY